MPNIKSAIKRVEIEKNNNQRNKSVKSKILTYVKKFKKAVEEKDAVTAEKEYKVVSGLLDSATNSNIIHKNSANRKKAHFAKLLESIK